MALDSEMISWPCHDTSRILAKVAQHSINFLLQLNCSQFYDQFFELWLYIFTCNNLEVIQDKIHSTLQSYCPGESHSDIKEELL